MSYPKLSDVLQNKDEDCQYFRRSFLHALSNDNLHTSSMNQIFSRQIVSCFSENWRVFTFCFGRSLVTTAGAALD